MIESLISVGSLLIELFKAKSMQDEQSSEELQEALYKVADLLDDVSFDLENGVYPHGKCAQMDMLALNLHDALAGDLPDEYLEILKNNLNSAVEIEKMYAYKDDPNQIQKLRTAAGYFRAAAILSTI
jgi:hypothetical protein